MSSYGQLRVQYLSAEGSSYLVVRLDDFNGRPIVIGNDLFVALGISRAFSGSIWKVEGVKIMGKDVQTF